MKIMIEIHTWKKSYLVTANTEHNPLGIYAMFGHVGQEIDGVDRGDTQKR